MAISALKRASVLSLWTRNEVTIQRVCLSVVHQVAWGEFCDQGPIQSGQGEVSGFGFQLQPVQHASLCWIGKLSHDWIAALCFSNIWSCNSVYQTINAWCTNTGMHPQGRMTGALISVCECVTCSRGRCWVCVLLHSKCICKSVIFWCR